MFLIITTHNSLLAIHYSLHSHRRSSRAINDQAKLIGLQQRLDDRHGLFEQAPRRGALGAFGCANFRHQIIGVNARMIASVFEHPIAQARIGPKPARIGRRGDQQLHCAARIVNDNGRDRF